MNIESLRQQILERYTTVYTFCRAHPELKKATVYLVLSGRYPGKIDVQAQKIKEALIGAMPIGQGENKPALSREEMVTTLQDIRCAHCRRLDRRACMDCKTHTEREARELYTRLFPGGVA